MRILRDADPADPAGGSPAPTPEPAKAPEPPAPAAGVTLTPEQYRALLDAQAKLAQVEADKRRAEDEREAARLEKLAADGKSKEALDALRAAKDQELAAERAGRTALENQILQAGLSAAVTDGMAGTPFVSPAAAAQARALAADKLESVRENGAVVVREKGTHRPAAEAVKAWLASDDAAHFLKASASGGTGAKGGTSPAPATPAAPVSASDLLIQYERDRIAAGRTPNARPGLAHH